MIERALVSAIMVHVSANQADPAHRSTVPVLPFDPAVYEARLTLVQADIADRELGGVLLFDPENIYWLTGYQTIGYFTFQTLFVPRSGPPTVIGRVVNRDLAMAHPTIGRFESILDTADPIDVLQKFLDRESGAQAQPLGLEMRAWYLTVRDYLRLTEQNVQTFVDWSGIIEPNRPVKSPAEIDRMQRAARAAEAGLQAAIDVIRPGKTENDIAAALFQANIAAGSEYLGHPPLVVAGKATSLCFAMWRRREIQSGDVVLLEAAGCVDRYHAILSRPVVVGPPTTAHREAADALQGVLEAAIGAIRRG